MRTLRNYVLGDLAYVFLTGLSIMTLLLVCGSVLVKMADLVINWGVDAGLLVRLFLCSTPFLFSFTLPMSVLVAVLLTFGKLSADHEITAMRASGIAFTSLVWPVLTGALVLSLFSFYLNDRLASASHYKMRRISAEIGMKTPASILEEGVFIKHFSDLVLFIHRIHGNELYGIRIYQPQKNGPTRMIVAERGEIVTNPEAGLVKLKLLNGTTDEPDPKDPRKFYKLRFDTYSLPLDLSNYRFREPAVKKLKEMTVTELQTEIDRLRNDHDITAFDYISEVHRRFAVSLSPFVFALVGIPLAVTARRGEKTLGFAIAAVLSTVYWALLVGAIAVAKSGAVNPAIPLHLPNLLYGAAAIVLIRKTAGDH